MRAQAKRADSSAAKAPRRTQAQRREATIALLLSATVDALAEVGYARTSVSEICARAGVTQGALFRHFATRLDVVAAATEDIARQHIARLEETFEFPAQLAPDPQTLRAVVLFIRELARGARHAAWREVMVAARTDDTLRAAVRDALGRYEEALLQTTWRFFAVEDSATEHVGTVALSLMHMFDSEALTVGVYPNARIEEARVEWATKVLGEALLSDR